jgi:hypothetical protein
MPINVTPVSRLSDHSIDVDHTPAGSPTNEWLPAGHPGAGPERAHRILVAQSVLHHYEKNESRGSGG